MWWQQSHIDMQWQDLEYHGNKILWMQNVDDNERMLKLWSFLMTLPLLEICHKPFHGPHEINHGTSFVLGHCQAPQGSFMQKSWLGWAWLQQAMVYECQSEDYYIGRYTLQSKHRERERESLCTGFLVWIVNSRIWICNFLCQNCNLTICNRNSNKF